MPSFLTYSRGEPRNILERQCEVRFGLRLPKIATPLASDLNCSRCGRWRDTGFAFVAGTLAVSSMARREAAQGEAAECRRHCISDRCRRRCFRQMARWGEWCKRVPIQNPIDISRQFDHSWFACQPRIAEIA